MYINLSLKNEYHETQGYYPTNKSEKVEYQLRDDEDKVVNSSLTPVLKHVYEVI